jgi:HK97 gp10 family phage protein
VKVEFTIHGANDLDKMLKELPAAVARRAAGNALRAAARVIRDEAKREVPVKTGELRKAIKVITGQSTQRDTRIVHVGVFGKEAPLAHLIEFGSIAHRIATRTKRVLVEIATGTFFGREVQHPGTPERPFLRPAADAKARESLNVLGEALGTAIEREAVRLAGRR